MKDETKHLEIKPIPDAETYYIPLSQNIGKPPVSVVRAGEKVYQYQLIAEADGSFSANLHSPVSGEVTGMEDCTLANGQTCRAIVIKNDFQNRQPAAKPFDAEMLTAEEILKAIEQAGIVGEGGAQFPTHVKYTLQDYKIDTFIINGTECEPYLSADYSLMNTRTDNLLKGIVYANKILKAKKIVISIENHNRELKKILEAAIEKNGYQNFSIKILPDKYPQGGELQLIKSVTGKEIRKGSLPRNEGVIVSNVGTIYAIYEALFEHKPLTERVITVSGELADKCGNYRVKIGTTVGHIIESLGIRYPEYTAQLVLGGPMMGKAVTELTTPIVKGTSGVLFLKPKKDERNNCIYCGYCADVCPMHLMPMMFVRNYRKNKVKQLDKGNINDCIECAACEYICPSNVPLITSIKKGKEELLNSIWYAKHR